MRAQSLFRLCAPFVLLQAGKGVADAAFDPLQHSGPASPYFDAPARDGASPDTPAGCVVDQAAYIVRHGSRYPEPGSFTGWQTLFAKFQNTSYTAHGPLAFIPTWVPPVDDIPHEPLFLTSTGAREAFDLGVELRKRYRLTPGGGDLTVWAASQQRVVDTASYFLRGYLSQGNYLSAPSLNRGTIRTFADSVNFTFADSLTPSSGCPLYNKNGDNGAATSTAFRATYQSRIADRLNAFLDGLTLAPADVGVMQDLCGFQAEIDGDTRFCDVFEPSEWLDYEYAHDLNYYYGSGPGNPLSATVAFPWVQAVTDLFVSGPNTTTANGTFTPPPLITGFTHDNNLPPVISALGLWNETGAPLALTRIASPDREFRASYVVAFRGYIALERLSCGTPLGSTVHHQAGQVVSTIQGPEQRYVRVRVDNAPVTIPGCASGPGRSCPLADFVAHVARQGRDVAGNFVQRCGLQNVANATGAVTFLTQSSVDGEVDLMVGEP